jgi:Uma2 family endonuclease
MFAHEPLVTADEFARIPDDDHHYELVAGRVVRMSPPGSRHAVLATRMAMLLGQHTEAHHLGAVMTPGGFKIAMDPDTVREPDVAFVRQDRIPAGGVPDGFWPGPPDLAIEITSPSDRPSEVQAKVADYLTRGVRLVWVLNPNAKTVTIHAPRSSPVTLGVDETLDAGDVLPAFACAVRRIFD